MATILAFSTVSCVSARRECAAKQADRKPVEARFTLTDGSVLNGEILVRAIPFKTTFGRVNIPVQTIAGVDILAANSVPQEDVSRAPADVDPRLVYWNTFDSELETRFAKTTKRAGDWRSGKLVEGKSGKALYTEGKADVYQLSIPANTLKPKGCIEFWAKIEPERDTFTDGAGWMRFFWMRHTRLEFAVNNGKGAGGITAYIANSVSGSSRSGGEGRYSNVLGPNYRDWHHYALVWSDQGVNVDTEKPRPWSAIFIDGKPVSHETNRMEAGEHFTFETIVGEEMFMVIAGSAFVSESWREHAVPFAIDELKIWNYDKTEFNLKQ